MNHFNLNNVSYNRGFTLIELLVVISITSVLSSIVFAPFNIARGRSRDAKRISELKSIKSGLDLYSEDHSGCYPDGNALSTDNNSIASNNYKYASKTLYDKIMNQNQNLEITPWTAIKPYSYRAFGNYSSCAMSTNATKYYPSYQLFVELENKNSVLNSDDDNDFSLHGVATDPPHSGLNLSDFFYCGSVIDFLDPCTITIIIPPDTDASREICTNDSVGNFDCVYEISSGTIDAPLRSLPDKLGYTMPPIIAP